MEAIILNLIPSLQDTPFLLRVVEILFALYFGSIIFNGFWALLTGFKDKL